MRERSALQLGLIVSVLLVCVAGGGEAYRILGISHFGAKSHHIVGAALYKGLAQAGHDVTVISPYPLKEPIKNYHDIPLTKTLELMKETVGGILEMAENSIVKNVIHFHAMGLAFTEIALSDPAVQQLLHSNQTFDVVITEVFLSEALFGISEHFKAPLIGLGTFGAISWNTDLVGSPSPPSYVPNPLLPFSDHMTYVQRLANMAFYTYDRLFQDLYYLPSQKALYKKYFPELKRSLYEVRKNTALVLLNQHVSLSFPRPYMPNMVEVGGMHINRERKPLPQNIQQFLDEAPNGVIYFSMGSNLKSKDLPLDKRAIILSTLRKLKQRVLWKFEDTKLEGKPDNVFISDWFPQDDILAHKNVKAFITHGGLLSTTESIYHGKPVIGIPIFGDQFLNMARAEANGYGISINFKTFNEKEFAAAIHRVLEDRSYTQKVQGMSARYRDQPLEPLKLAIHWVEHVARHKGAKYLHSAGQDLCFFSYHSLDTIPVLYGGIILVVLLLLLFLRYILRTIWRALTGKGQTKSKKVKKH